MNSCASSNMNGNVYQVLVETSPDLMWHCDAEGRFTYLNPAWETTLGFPPAEMLGKKLSDFQPPEAAAHFSEAFSRLFQGSEMRGHATVLTTHSGAKVDVLVHSRFLCDDNGRILGACGTVQVVTQQTATAEKLRESESRYRMVSELATDYSFRLGVAPDGRVSMDSVTDNFSAITGRTPEESLSMDSWGSFLHPEDLKEVLSLLQQMIKRPQTGKVECRSIIHGSIQRWVEVIAKSEEDPQAGRVTSIIGAVKDITARKQSEDALRQLNQALLKAKEVAEQSEEKFRLMLKNSNDAFVLINAKGEQIFISDAAIRDTGYTLEELNGPFDRVIFPEDLEIVSRAWKEVLANPNELVRVQYRHKHKFKEYIWYEAVAQNYFGNPLINAAVVNVRDITEQKNAEAAIRLRESYLTAIIENQPGLVWLKDRESRFLAVNRKLTQICGRQHPEELIGKNDLEVFPVELARKYREDDQRVISAGKAFSTEELIADRGENRWFETFKMPVRNEQGTIIGTTGFAHDITQRKRVEDTLRNTQRLDSLGVLAGGIAHDFNNLLGGIFGYIDLARHTTTEKPVAEYLAQAMGTIDRVRSLTMQLLTFAKGGAPVKKTDSLAPLIEETVKFALSGSRVLCHFTLPARLWPCEFDRNQIGQVIDNIVINAQQAMPDGGSIDVRGENVVIDEKSPVTLPAGNYVKLSVTDKGIGMPKEILSRIFDPFFTTKAKGHGLGLATCYSIIKRHGGCIEVDSEPGTGSTFHVYLPASLVLVSETLNQTVSRHHGFGTIVIMDDEKVIRDILSRMLQSLGYSVVCTQHGGETISYLSDAVTAGRPTVAVILDLTIPGGMGGTETCAEIRKIDPHLPILVVSGYAEDPVIANPQQHGFNGSLSKPFTLQNLAATLTCVRAGRNS